MFDEYYEDGQIYMPYFNTNQEISAVQSFKVDGGLKNHEIFQIQVKKALNLAAKVDPYEKEPPKYLSAFEGITWEDGKNLKDSRPRILDGITKQKYLLDSGAMISAIPATDQDRVQPELALEAANGAVIDCYGYKDLDIRINRKTYSQGGYS